MGCEASRYAKTVRQGICRPVAANEARILQKSQADINGIRRTPGQNWTATVTFTIWSFLA